jgi:hypothetical protein
MNDTQTAELDAGQSARAYASTRPNDFTAGSRAAVVLGVLVAAITRIEQEAAKQIAADLERQESTEQKRAAINTLVEMMRAMNQIARSINNQLNGIADKFKLGRGGAQATLARARAFITEATPIPTEFTSRGMPATFLADMQAAIDAADQAEGRQSIALTAQSEATSAIAVALKTLRAAMRELDAIFTAKYRQDPSTLAAWRTASHVEKTKKKATKKSAPPPSSTPAPQSS